MIWVIGLGLRASDLGFRVWGLVYNEGFFVGHLKNL